MTTPGNTPNPPVTLTLSDGKEYQIAMIENRHLLRLEEKLRIRRIEELKVFAPDDLEAFIRIRDEEVTNLQLATYADSLGGQIELGIMAILECNPDLELQTVQSLIANDLKKVMNEIMPPVPVPKETTEEKDEPESSDPQKKGEKITAS